MPRIQERGDGVPLSVAQVGNGDSTNIAWRSQYAGGGIVITSTVGGAPTVTVNILGSLDGVNFYNIPYALTSAPTTFVLSAITITTATTNTYLLNILGSERTIKLNYSANNNVTLTATAYLQ
jgi:hypothetical protein